MVSLEWFNINSKHVKLNTLSAIFLQHFRVTLQLTVSTVIYPRTLSLIEPFSVSRNLVKKKERKYLQNILFPIQINVLTDVHKFCQSAFTYAVLNNKECPYILFYEYSFSRNPKLLSISNCALLWMLYYFFLMIPSVCVLCAKVLEHPVPSS